MKQGGSKWKKPSIPNYNPNAMTKEQRLAVKQFVKSNMEKQAVMNNFNLRKSQ